MLYVPARFLFLHIPRSAGMSISTTLLTALIREQPLTSLLYTSGLTLPWHQHATADELQHLVRDFDTIYKFAVERPTCDIIASDYRLHQQGAIELAAGEEPLFIESIAAARNETLEQFKRRRWNPWLRGQDAWSRWTGGRLDIHRLRFDHLDEDWIKTLDAIGIPRCELNRCNQTR